MTTPRFRGNKSVRSCEPPRKKQKESVSYTPKAHHQPRQKEKRPRTLRENPHATTFVELLEHLSIHLGLVNVGENSELDPALGSRQSIVGRKLVGYILEFALDTTLGIANDLLNLSGSRTMRLG